jgi:hypothetical protein
MSWILCSLKQAAVPEVTPLRASKEIASGGQGLAK